MVAVIITLFLALPVLAESDLTKKMADIISKAPDKGFYQVTADDVSTWIKSKKADFVVIDVRSRAEEFKKGHIPGIHARSISYNRDVSCYCRDSFIYGKVCFSYTLYDYLENLKRKEQFFKFYYENNRNHFGFKLLSVYNDFLWQLHYQGIDMDKVRSIEYYSGQSQNDVENI